MAEYTKEQLDFIARMQGKPTSEDEEEAKEAEKDMLPLELVEVPKDWRDKVNDAMNKASGFVNNVGNLAYKASSLIATLLMSKSNPVAAGMAVVAVVPEILNFFENTSRNKIDGFHLALAGFEPNDSGVLEIISDLGLLEGLPRFLRWKNNAGSLIAIKIDGETSILYRGDTAGKPNHTRIWVKEGLEVGDLVSKILEKAFDVQCSQLSIHKDKVTLKPVLFSGVYEGKNDPVKFADNVERFRRKGLDYSVILYGPPGSGKCLGAGTKLIKYDGSIVEVQDVKEGDLLMGPDSKPRKVLSTTKGFGPMFKIKPVKGEPWVCNDVHVLTLKNTGTKKITDIALDKFLKLTKPRQQREKLFKVSVDFPAIAESPIDPYFLGVWFGDGTKKCGELGLKGIEITKPDSEIESICHKVSKDWGLDLNVKTPKNKTKSYAIVGKKGLENHLTSTMRTLLGPTLKIPDCIKLGSKETRLAFLAGILDTDGYLDTNTFEIAQKRADWAEDIEFIARSVGLCVTRRPKIVNGDLYERMQISGHTNMIPTRIARKQATPRKQIKDVLNTGFAVEQVADNEYYGFMLDGDGRFLLSDFTVTHNTTMLMSYAELCRKRALIISPDIISGGFDISVYVDVLKPDVLLLDDYDRADSYNFAYTTLPAIKSRHPQLLVCITCNHPARLGSAILRPGRGGHMMKFDAPDAEDRKIIFLKYLEHYKVPNTENLDIDLILSNIDEEWTHDWIRHLAKMAIVFNTQEELLEFIETTNQQLEWVGKDMDEDEY